MRNYGRILALITLIIPEVRADINLSESLFVKSKSVAAQYVFSGTTGGGIDYFQSCFASDNTCSSCSLPILFTPYSTSLPYGSYNISMTALANLLKQTAPTANTYYIKLGVQSVGFDCASNTAYCRAEQDINSNNLCLTVNYDGTTVTSLIQNDNGQVSLTSNPKTQYLYIVDTVQTKNILACPLSANGTTSTCTLAPGGTSTSLGTPRSAAITTINGIQYIYIAGQGYIDGSGLIPSAITQCTLGTSGSLSSCIQTTSNNWSWLQNPGSMTITTINNTQYAYISDVTDNTITQCTLDTSGVFGSCQSAYSGNFNGTPLGMYFALVNNSRYVYVAVSQGFQQGIQRCLVGSNGLFSSCTLTGSNAGASMSWSPRDIKMAYSSNPTTPTWFAYIADTDNAVLYKCRVNNTSADLENCVATPSTSAPSWSPLQISFGISQRSGNAQLYAYIADDSSFSSLWQCAMQTSGELGSCSRMTTGYNSDFFVGTTIGYTTS